LDADDASNFTGSTWNDKSGTNNHAVNGTPGTTSMPTVTTWSNGRRAARFVKESKNSIKTTNSIPLYVTYFIVARVQDVIGASGFGLLMVNNYDGQRQLRTNSTSFPVSVFYFTQTGGTNMVLGSFSQGQGFLFSGTVTSDSAIGYSNGVQCGTSGVNPNTIPSRHYFGSGDGDAAYVSADFGEILIYDSILTTSQRQQVEGYLAHKWGLNTTYGTNTPLSIPGCQLWLDGADTSSMALSGSNVTQWNDKSGNGRNTTSVIGSSVRVLNAVNNLPGVYFNSTAFRGPFVYSGTQLHCFLVGTMEDNGSFTRILSIGNGAQDDFNSPLTTISFCRAGSGVSALRVIRNDAGVNASFPAYNTPFLAVSAQYANTQEISVNGGTPTTSTTNTSASFGTTTYGLGIQSKDGGAGEQSLVGYLHYLHSR
jgi:hypothetical protein